MRESKHVEAEKVIFNLVKNGNRVSRKELIFAGKKNNIYIGETTIYKNLCRLVKAGRIDANGGDGKNKYYFEKRPA